jgi:hypothetical protein
VVDHTIDITEVTSSGALAGWAEPALDLRAGLASLQDAAAIHTVFLHSDLHLLTSGWDGTTE